jgi:hypothetical protein
MTAILAKPTDVQRTNAIYFVVNRMALEIRSLSRTNDLTAFPKIQRLSDAVAFLVRDCGLNIQFTDEWLCEWLNDVSLAASRYNYKTIYVSHLANGE